MQTSLTTRHAAAPRHAVRACTPFVCANRKRGTACHAVAASSDVKTQLFQLAGSNYGHDKDEQDRKQVEALAERLAALQDPASEPAALPLTGSRWGLVYCNAKGPSSGKVGPFVLQSEQEFPTLGDYTNVSRLGPLTLRLKGIYSQGSRERLELEFKQLIVSLGPLAVYTKDFAPGAMRGHWRTVFADADLRVFYTNKGSLFVLKRLGSL